MYTHVRNEIIEPRVGGSYISEETAGIAVCIFVPDVKSRFWKRSAHASCLHSHLVSLWKCMPASGTFFARSAKGFHVSLSQVHSLDPAFDNLLEGLVSRGHDSTCGLVTYGQ